MDGKELVADLESRSCNHEIPDNQLRCCLWCADCVADAFDTALVQAVAREREACAAEGDAIEAGFPGPRSYEQAHYLMGVQALQAAIRARTTQ